MVEQSSTKRVALQPSAQFKQTKTTTITGGGDKRPGANISANSGNVMGTAVSTNKQTTAQAAMQANTTSPLQTTAQLVPPSILTAKEGSVQLQSTLRGLKDNYVVIEQQIEQETQKQRQGHQERYAKALDKIVQLKKILKTEIEQRKNADEHFRTLIDEKSQECLNSFTVGYLNKLHSMHETVQTFDKRKQALELKRQQLRNKIETSMRQSREDIIESVQTKQAHFE